MTRSPSLTSHAYLLLGVTLFLVLGGVLMIYSASSVADYVYYEDSAYHAKKQLTFAALGVVALYLASLWNLGRKGSNALIDIRRPEAVAWAVWGAALVGLILVETIGVGKWGATRSLDLGFAFVQPSEYAKLGCLLVTAVLLVQLRRGDITGKTFLVRLGAVLLPVVLLIMKQPDMGTTMSLLFAVAMMLWLGGVERKWLGLASAIGLPLAIAAIALRGYRMDRVTSFLDPWADPSETGYQIIQSLYAFGSGGILGEGLGLSRQKFFYLPAAHTDFIFAVIGEELGLLGSLSIVAAFALFAWAGMRIALSCKDHFGRLVAGGLTAMIVMQALMNMAAVTGLMPITGIPLPLVSAGGSSLTLTLGCVGLILAVSRAGAARPVRSVRPSKTREAERASSAQWRRDGGAHSPRFDRRRASGR
ncbi:MAG: FtsW/RodA/SpoVE family cell cycle protein [Coriobacteriia bacterium]